MRRDSETGEFELVLGNGQLLSGLFIVVLLFAVFFALGYVVGQNSPRSAKLSDAATTPSTDRPQPVTSPQPAAQPPAAGVETPTQPVPDANSGASEETPNAPATTAPEGAAAPAAGSGELAAGSYWQVMALKQADAEVVVRSLKDKGFPALMAPGRNNLTRVLVGPYDDMAAMSKAKTELEKRRFSSHQEIAANRQDPYRLHELGTQIRTSHSRSIPARGAGSPACIAILGDVSWNRRNATSVKMSR